MSHAIISKLDETKITNIQVLKTACEMMGLEFTECEPGKGHYRTWKDQTGSWVGDWPLPEGVSAAEMGDNADFVISVPKSLDPQGRTYQLGIVRDEKAECWYPAYDFYAGGQGLEAYIGEVKLKGKKVISSCGRLMNHYKAAQAVLANQARGKAVHFQKVDNKLVILTQ